jgi:myo-inositol 2-dehydrogenase / D-chiro-inositol 1-dehydrogenase
MSQPTTTRRNFLTTSAGLAAAGLAAPYVWTSGSVRAEQANDRLNVAAIGVGGRGSGIGHQAGGRGNMVACADVHRGNAESFASRYDGRCEIYTDYRKILERKDVDAIICGTPDHWHTKISIDALQAGKDVYCEKPLTLTMEESRQICDAVKSTARVFQVGTQQRSENDRMFLKAIVVARSGRLGDKLHALSSVGGATTGGPFPAQEPPPELDWDFWLGPAPKVPFTPNRIGWNFRWWFEYSGGQVTDWGVHHTDIALWALGGDVSGVVEATPVESHFPLGRELTRDTLLGEKPIQELPASYNVANRFKVDMKLANGNEVTLFSGSNELILTGDRGRIRVNRGSLTGRPIEEMTDQEKAWLDEEVVKLYGGEPRSHMGNFFDCCKSRQQPVSDVFSHAHSVNACHMANIAMLLDRTVKFDPAKYDFVDDKQASGLMSRPVREPWTVKL